MNIKSIFCARAWFMQLSLVHKRNCNEPEMIHLQGKRVDKKMNYYYNCNLWYEHGSLSSCLIWIAQVIWNHVFFAFTCIAHKPCERHEIALQHLQNFNAIFNAVLSPKKATRICSILFSVGRLCRYISPAIFQQLWHCFIYKWCVFAMCVFFG